MKQVGFEYQAFVGTTDFKSSPVTTGALFLAKKKLFNEDFNVAQNIRPAAELPDLKGNGKHSGKPDDST